MNQLELQVGLLVQFLHCCLLGFQVKALLDNQQDDPLDNLRFDHQENLVANRRDCHQGFLLGNRQDVQAVLLLVAHPHYRLVSLLESQAVYLQVSLPGDLVNLLLDNLLDYLLDSQLDDRAQCLLANHHVDLRVSLRESHQVFQARNLLVSQQGSLH